MKTKRNRGFTLVEILIVVVILGILAAIVIPQFSNASEEASINRVKSDLQTARSQIQLYKIQHLGSLPATASFSAHMTGYTLASTASNGAVVTASTAGALGKYLQQIPKNPFVDTAVGDTIVDHTGTAVAGTSTAGWTYDDATGDFYAVQGSCPAATDMTIF